MKLSTTFEYPRICLDKDTESHVLISAQAPKVELQTKRPKITIAAAIDVSSSMVGDKIDYAKKSLMKLIDHLTPEDQLGIITFSHTISTMSEIVPMTQENKDTLKAKVSQLYASGSTNFSGAMLEAIKQSTKVDGKCRVIIFTDGQPTAGVTGTDQILEMLKQNRHENVSISTFGYGSDHDPNLLTQVSKLAEGNFAFVKNPDEALVAFGKELGGLLSCYAQNLTFTIRPKESIEILEVLNDVDVEELADGTIKVTVPDLYSEETRHLVLQVRIPKPKKIFPRDVSLVEVSLDYAAMPDGKPAIKEARGKVRFVKDAADASTKPVQEVVNQLAIVKIARAQQEAEKAAKRGDFVTANAVFTNLDLNGADAKILRSSSLVASNYSTPGVYTATSFSRADHSHSLHSGRHNHGSDLGLYEQNSTQEAFANAFKDGAGNGDLGAAGTGAAGNSHNHTLLGQAGNVAVQGNAGTSISFTDANGTITTIAGDVASGLLNANTSGTLVLNKTEETQKKKLKKNRTDAQW